MKTQFCDECKYFDTLVSFEEFMNGEFHKTPCTRGLKPRFYKPRDMDDNFWGWKRKCADFQKSGIRKK